MRFCLKISRMTIMSRPRSSLRKCWRKSLTSTAPRKPLRLQTVWRVKLSALLRLRLYQLAWPTTFISRKSLNLWLKVMLRRLWFLSNSTKVWLLRKSDTTWRLAHGETLTIRLRHSWKTNWRTWTPVFLWWSTLVLVVTFLTWSWQARWLAFRWTQPTMRLSFQSAARTPAVCLALRPLSQLVVHVRVLLTRLLRLPTRVTWLVVWLTLHKTSLLLKILMATMKVTQFTDQKLKRRWLTSQTVWLVVMLLKQFQVTSIRTNWSRVKSQIQLTTTKVLKVLRFSPYYRQITLTVFHSEVTVLICRLVNWLVIISQLVLSPLSQLVSQVLSWRFVPSTTLVLLVVTLPKVCLVLKSCLKRAHQRVKHSLRKLLVWLTFGKMARSISFKLRQNLARLSDCH